MNENRNMLGNDIYTVRDMTFSDHKPMDYSEVISDSCFKGEIPFLTIIEKITEQFQNYMELEDSTNYVYIFYDELENSYKVLELDESEEHPQEIRDVLFSIYTKFVDTMLKLFDTHLDISIVDMEGGYISKEDLEHIIRALYEYFILNAEDNFKLAIGSNIKSELPSQENDEEYINQLELILDRFAPYITTIECEQFLKDSANGNRDVYDLFINGKIVGNFLNKYTPNLYKNEFYKVKLINYLSIMI